MNPRAIARPLVPAVWLLAAAISPLPAQEAENKPSSIGDLLGKMKDLKVPESVTGLPQQIVDLKDAYLKTAATVEELKKEVEGLRAEVATLKAAQQRLEGAAADKAKVTASGQTGPVDILASDLGNEFAQDRAAALKRYQGRYLRVQGAVARFEPVASHVDIHLRVDGASLTIRCSVKRDSSFYVDVSATKDRLVSRADRSAVLVVGQPVVVLGTLDGADLNVHLVNCTLEGIVAKAPPPVEKNP